MAGLVAELGRRAALRRPARPTATPRRRADRRRGAGSRSIDPARDLDAGERLGIRFVVPGDAEWPTQLDDLDARASRSRSWAASPLGLWVRGPLRLDELADAGRGGRLAVGHDLRHRRRRRLARRARPGRRGGRLRRRVRHRPGRPPRRAGRPTGRRSRCWPAASTGPTRRPTSELLDHLAGHGAVVSELRAGLRADADAVPGPQPGHRGARPRHGRGRGGASAAARSTPPTGRPRLNRPLMGVPGPGDQRAVGGRAPADPDRRGHAGDAGRPTCSSSSAAPGEHLPDEPARRRPRRATGSRRAQRQVLDAVPAASGRAGPTRSRATAGLGAGRDAGRRSPRWTRRRGAALVEQSPTGWRLAEAARSTALTTAVTLLARRVTAPRRGRDGPDELPEALRAACSATTSATWSPSATSPRTRCGPTSATSAGLLDHADRLGLDRRRPSSTCARCAAGWPSSRRSGMSRTTLARRATAARVFTAWLRRTGRAPRDAGASLGSPKAHRTAAAGAARRRGARPDRGGGRARRRRQPGRAARRRDARAALRHRASGSASWSASTSTTSTGTATWSGSSARAARSARCRSAARRPRRSTAGSAEGRPALRGRGVGGALFLGARGRRIDQRAVRTLVHRRIADVPGAPDIGPARAAAHRGHPPARGRRRPALGPGAARPRLAGDDAALHPRHHRPAARGLPAGPPAGLTLGQSDRRAAPATTACGRRQQRAAAGPARRRPGGAGRGRSRPRIQPQCRQARGKQCEPGEPQACRSASPAATGVADARPSAATGS